MSESGGPPPGPYGGGYYPPPGEQPPPPGQQPPPQGWGAPGQYGPPGPPPPPYAGWGPPPGFPGGYPGGYPAGPPKTHGKAIAVLVLGISSLIACLGLPGIVALCLAPGARREIAESRGRLTGEGLIKAGVICSWISIALALLVIVVFAVVFGVAISNGSGNIQIDPAPTLEF